jgi:AcrR family transcriptional regulator
VLSESGIGSSEGEEFPRAPLPRGRHRLSPREVAEDQRRRILAAMAESVALRGYAATSVERIIELAGVSRGTFYEQFSNRQECLLAAHAEVFERLYGALSHACAGEESWGEGVAAAIAAALEFADRAPEQARLLTLDAIAADAQSACRGLAAADRLAALLRSGRERHPDAADLPEVTERALVGAVASAINWRLLTGESLAGLEPQLIQLVLTPYLGASAAARLAGRRGERRLSPDL